MTNAMLWVLVGFFGVQVVIAWLRWYHLHLEVKRLKLRCDVLERRGLAIVSARRSVTMD